MEEVPRTRCVGGDKELSCCPHFGVFMVALL
jgi:hypothetical protein